MEFWHISHFLCDDDEVREAVSLLFKESKRRFGFQLTDRLMWPKNMRQLPLHDKQEWKIVPLDHETLF